jgi:hypothetical protein
MKDINQTYMQFEVISKRLLMRNDRFGYVSTIFFMKNQSEERVFCLVPNEIRKVC